MINILVFGASGRLGKQLTEALLGYHTILSTRDDTDLTSPAAIMHKIDSEQPNVIINAAACNGIERCAGDPLTAYQVNEQAPFAMAIAAKKIGALLVHYSTDYVFSDHPEPITELTQPNPLSIYGHSKLAGERAIQAVDGSHLIYRVASLYSDDLSGPLDCIKQARAGRGTPDNPIQVPKQFCAPISAKTVAIMTLASLRILLEAGGMRAYTGLYHLVSCGALWKKDFAQTALRIVGCDANLRIVEGTLLHPRPVYLPMSNARFLQRFGIEPWDPHADLMSVLSPFKLLNACGAGMSLN